MNEETRELTWEEAIKMVEDAGIERITEEQKSDLAFIFKTYNRIKIDVAVTDDKEML